MTLKVTLLSTAAGDRIKASPLARKIAAEMGVDLDPAAGQRPGGAYRSGRRHGCGCKHRLQSKPAAPQPPSTEAATAYRRSRGQKDTFVRHAENHRRTPAGEQDNDPAFLSPSSNRRRTDDESPPG